MHKNRQSRIKQASTKQRWQFVFHLRTTEDLRTFDPFPDIVQGRSKTSNSSPGELQPTLWHPSHRAAVTYFIFHFAAPLEDSKIDEKYPLVSHQWERRGTSLAVKQPSAAVKTGVARRLLRCKIRTEAFFRSTSATVGSAARWRNALICIRVTDWSEHALPRPCPPSLPPLLLP